jgi:hypothetical protein
MKYESGTILICPPVRTHLAGLRYHINPRSHKEEFPPVRRNILSGGQAGAPYEVQHSLQTGGRLMVQAPRALALHQSHHSQSLTISLARNRWTPREYKNYSCTAESDLQPIISTTAPRLTQTRKAIHPHVDIRSTWLGGSRA